MSFEHALAFVLAWEGGQSDDVRDPGGRTRFGVSSRAHPEVDLDRLTRADAARLYRTAYWDRLRLDGLPPKLAVAVFDAAVNAGPKRAVIWLQRALNSLPQHAALAEDGLLGSRTAAAIQGASGAAERLELVRSRMLLARLGHYAELAAQKPALRAFLRGWLNRVLALNHYHPEDA